MASSSLSSPSLITSSSLPSLPPPADEKSLITLVEELGKKVLYSVSVNDPQNTLKKKLSSSIETCTRGCSFISVGDLLFQVGGIDTFHKYGSKNVFCYDTLNDFSRIPVPSLNYARKSPVLMVLGQTIYACSILTHGSSKFYFLEIEFLETRDIGSHSKWQTLEQIKLNPVPVEIAGFNFSSFVSTENSLFISIEDLGYFHYNSLDGVWKSYYQQQLPFYGQGLFLDGLVYSLSESGNVIFSFFVKPDFSFELLSFFDTTPRIESPPTMVTLLVPTRMDRVALVRINRDNMEDSQQICVDYYTIGQITGNVKRSKRLRPILEKKCRPGNARLNHCFIINN